MIIIMFYGLTTATLKMSKTILSYR